MSATSLLGRALERVCVLLDGSAEDGWSDLTPAEAAKILRDTIAALARGQAVDYRSLRVEFAPTGPIQEIVMANGWHDEYVQIAQVVDNHVDR